MQKIKDDTWVWVFIQNPEGSEQLVGQVDEKNNISFIPAFLEKDEALKCYNSLALEKGRKYETQAIMYEDLIRYAFENSFLVFMLNGSGKILDKIHPQPK